MNPVRVVNGFRFDEPEDTWPTWALVAMIVVGIPVGVVGGFAFVVWLFG